MARRYFANRNPLGERFGYGRPKIEIVGVVRDARVTNVRDAAVPMVYDASQQWKDYSNNIDVRAVGDPRWIVGKVRKAVREADSNLPVTRVATMNDQISSNVNQSGWWLTSRPRSGYSRSCWPRSDCTA